MRQNRSKAYRKLMAMYSTSFGFRQPYQVLGALKPLRRWGIWARAQCQCLYIHNIPVLTPLTIVDSEMCAAAILQKIDLLARIESVLIGSVKMSE